MTRMKIYRSRYLPPKQFSAIYLLGVLICRPETVITDRLMRHERIHRAQMMEMLLVGFYLWYVVEWLVRLCLRQHAYLNISFEREAYANSADPDYLSHRRHYAWWDYIRRAKK